jgi:hypothetical protein
MKCHFVYKTGFIIVNKTNLEMTTENKLTNKKTLFSVEVFLEISPSLSHARVHTHTHARAH